MSSLCVKNQQASCWAVWYCFLRLIVCNYFYWWVDWVCESRRYWINSIVYGGIYPPSPPCQICFNKFFFTQAKSLKFSDFKFLYFRHNVAKFYYKNIDLLANYDTFVINDWKFFSYKHMSMFFISRFFIHSLLQLYFS